MTLLFSQICMYEDMNNFELSQMSTCLVDAVDRDWFVSRERKEGMKEGEEQTLCYTKNVICAILKSMNVDPNTRYGNGIYRYGRIALRKLRGCWFCFWNKGAALL